MLIGVAMVWGGYRLMASLPFTPVSEAVMSDPLRKYGLDLWRSVQVVLPAAVMAAEWP